MKSTLDSARRCWPGGGRAGQFVAERERWTDHVSDAGHSAHWRRSSSLFDTTLSVIGMVFVSPFDVFTSQ